MLALTRQNVPQLRLGVDGDNRCARGAYEIVAAEAARSVSLFASGSEVAIAIAAQKLLAARRRARRASCRYRVSSCCFAAPDAERAAIIGTAPVKVAVEAGIRQGWDAIIGSDGTFVGMTGFGASAPYKAALPTFRHYPRKSGGGGAGCARSASVEMVVGRLRYVGSRSDQRIWPHRPQHSARRRRGRAQGHRVPRHQRSRPGRDQRASAALRFRAWPLPGRSHRQGRHHQLRQRRHQGHRDQRPDATAVEGARHRRRARMHRHFHRQGQGGGASAGRRQARAGLGAGRRRRHHRRLRRQPRQAEQVAHGRLQRVLHDQLSRPGGEGAQRCGRHRQGLHDHDPRLHQRSADARSGAQGSLPGARGGAST